MKKKRWVVTIVLAVLLIVAGSGRNLRTNADTYIDTENTIDFSELKVGDILKSGVKINPDKRFSRVNLTIGKDYDPELSDAGVPGYVYDTTYDQWDGEYARIVDIIPMGEQFGYDEFYQLVIIVEGVGIKHLTNVAYLRVGDIIEEGTRVTWDAESVEYEINTGTVVNWENNEWCADKNYFVTSIDSESGESSKTIVKLGQNFDIHTESTDLSHLKEGDLIEKGTTLTNDGTKTLAFDIDWVNAENSIGNYDDEYYIQSGENHEFTESLFVTDIQHLEDYDLIRFRKQGTYLSDMSLGEKIYKGMTFFRRVHPIDQTVYHVWFDGTDENKDKVFSAYNMWIADKDYTAIFDTCEPTSWTQSFGLREGIIEASGSLPTPQVVPSGAGSVTIEGDWLTVEPAEGYVFGCYVFEIESYLYSDFYNSDSLKINTILPINSITAYFYKAETSTRYKNGDVIFPSMLRLGDVLEPGVIISAESVLSGPHLKENDSFSRAIEFVDTDEETTELLNDGSWTVDEICTVVRAPFLSEDPIVIAAGEITPAASEFTPEVYPEGAGTIANGDDGNYLANNENGFLFDCWEIVTEKGTYTWDDISWKLDTIYPIVSVTAKFMVDYYKTGQIINENDRIRSKYETSTFVIESDDGEDESVVIDIDHPWIADKQYTVVMTPFDIESVFRLRAGTVEPCEITCTPVVYPEGAGTIESDDYYFYADAEEGYEFDHWVIVIDSKKYTYDDEYWFVNTILPVNYIAAVYKPEGGEVPEDPVYEPSEDPVEEPSDDPTEPNNENNAEVVIEKNDKITDTGVGTVTVPSLEDFAADLEEGTEVKMEVAIETREEVLEKLGEENLRKLEEQVSKTFEGVSEEKVKTEFLNLTISKSVNNGDSTPINDVNTVLEIVIEYDMSGKFSPVIIREHEGTVSAFTRLTAKPAAAGRVDGTFFIEGTGTTAKLYVYARYFSVYSIVYATTELFTVTFDDDNGTTKQVTVETGGKVAKPADPTKNGYTFKGWYSGDKVWDFNTAVTSDVTLKAQWTKDGVVAPPTGDNSSSVLIMIITTMLFSACAITFSQGRRKKAEQ